MDGFGGDRVDRGGRDFAGNGVHAGEDSHEDSEEIDGVETDLQNGTENLITQDLGHSGEVGISYLVVHSGGKQGEESGSREERGPQDFSASGLEEGYTSNDPEGHQSPWSSPMILRN